MADLTISELAAVRIIDSSNGPNGESLNVGDFCRLDTTSGKWVKGNATTATEAGGKAGIVTETLGTAVRVMHVGYLDVGTAVDGLAFDAPIYVSNTDGALADAAGTVSVQVGRVVPGWGDTTADKLIFVDFNK